MRDVFLDWLKRNQPLAEERILSRIRATRDGQLSDSRFGSRMRGEGELAKQIAETFRLFAHKLELDRQRPSLDASLFRAPRPASGQLRLFE